MEGLGDTALAPNSLKYFWVERVMLKAGVLTEDGDEDQTTHVHSVDHFDDLATLPRYNFAISRGEIGS